jgi:hypothetical protein
LRRKALGKVLTSKATHTLAHLFLGVRMVVVVVVVGNYLIVTNLM